jgi:hypothetical protein
MVHGIGSIPGIVVIVIIIGIMNHNCGIVVSPMIRSMVIIMIMTINPNCHYCNCRKIRWIITIVVRGCIRNVNR